MMMSHRLLAALSLLLLGACSSASSQDTASDPSMGATPEPSTAPADGDSPNAPGKDPEREFTLQDSETAGSAHGESESTLKPTTTEAVVKFVVVDKETNDPLTGIVISLADEAGATFYTKETDGTGYAEVLVPVGHQYDLVYLSLGRRNVSARVPVTDEPKQNIKLTLRYKSRRPTPVPAQQEGPGFVLDGVTFDTAKSTIRAESFPRLDGVVEYMMYKPSARIRIVGHTDNVGNPQANKALSESRAQACRSYLMQHGIDGSRIETAGYGDEQPIASNSTPEGRQKNRRIEAREL